MLLLQQLKSYRWSSPADGTASPSKRGEAARSGRAHAVRSGRVEDTMPRARSKSPSRSGYDDIGDDRSALPLGRGPGFELQYRFHDKEKALSEAGFEPDHAANAMMSKLSVFTRSASPERAYPRDLSPSRVPTPVTRSVPARSESPIEKKERARAMLAASLEQFKAAAAAVQQSFVELGEEDPEMAAEASVVASRVTAIESRSPSPRQQHKSGSMPILPSEYCAVA